MITHGLATRHVSSRVAELRYPAQPFAPLRSSAPAAQMQVLLRGLPLVASQAARSHEPCVLVADSWPGHSMEVAEASRALRGCPRGRAANETGTIRNLFGKCILIHHCATSFWVFAQRVYAAPIIEDRPDLSKRPAMHSVIPSRAIGRLASVIPGRGRLWPSTSPLYLDEVGGCQR